MRSVSLRRHIATISQKMNLPAGAITENIAPSEFPPNYADASVLLLDEPTASLDAEAEGKLIGALKRLREEGKTIVTAMDRGQLLQIADQTFQICKEHLLSSDV